MARIAKRQDPVPTSATTVRLDFGNSGLGQLVVNAVRAQAAVAAEVARRLRKV
jgi:hypothetical protein